MKPNSRNKGPGERKDYGLDWTEALAKKSPDEVITASAWAVVSGSVTINGTPDPVGALPGHSFDELHTAVWCSGGTEGSRSVIKNTITTSSGLVLEDTIQLTIRDHIAPTTAGVYCALADMENIFGRFAVETWANIEDVDGGDATARIVAFIADAEQLIDDALRGGRYATPFVAPIPRQIKTICAKLAGIAMYEARGVVDHDPNTGAAEHRYGFMKKDALRDLSRIRTGVLRLNIADRGVTHPQVVDGDELEWYQKPRYPYDRMPWDSRSLY